MIFQWDSLIGNMNVSTCSIGDVPNSMRIGVKRTRKDSIDTLIFDIDDTRTFSSSLSRRVVSRVTSQYIPLSAVSRSFVIQHSYISTWFGIMDSQPWKMRKCSETNGSRSIIRP